MDLKKCALFQADDITLINPAQSKNTQACRYSILASKIETRKYSTSCYYKKRSAVVDKAVTKGSDCERTRNRDKSMTNWYGGFTNTNQCNS